MRSTPPVMKMDCRWSAERAKARTFFTAATTTARHTKRDNNTSYSSAAIRTTRVSASVNHFVALGRRLKFPSITLVVAQASTQPTDYVTCSPNHAVLLAIRLSAICRHVCQLSACCCRCLPALLPYSVDKLPLCLFCYCRCCRFRSRSYSSCWLPRVRGDCTKIGM